MTARSLQPGASSDHASALAGLQVRVREQGLLLIPCDDQGRIERAPAAGDDWLSDLICRTPMVRQALRDAARRWRDDADLAPQEALPGLWFAPIPRLSRRRQVGYLVTVILTTDLLDSEHFAALCQSAQVDFTLEARRVAALPPASPNDVPRFAAFMRQAYLDHTRLQAANTAVESIGQQLAFSYEEISLLYTITDRMTVVDRPERFIETICQELLATLPFEWIGAHIADTQTQLRNLAGRLIVAGEPAASMHTLRELVRDVEADIGSDDTLVLQPQVNDGQQKYAPMGRTVLVHPVARDGRSLGMLIAGDKRGPDLAPSSTDTKLLAATASHLGIFLENAGLYEDLNAMFLGTLEALTAAIDAKDRYTCGHSQRVAHLSQRLAEAVGLDEAAVRRVHIAGLVHDVGKIGVPERVLTKAGRLTRAEFAEIQKHPEIGHHILKDIPQLQDVLPGVLHHHERWDGRGYPRGIAGEDIPLIARLIALADSFDAMSSNRIYRPGMQRTAVLAEIRRCAGTQFDPELVPLFVNLDLSTYDRLVAAHAAWDTETGSSEHAA